jgi:tRNA threonylcarbamoyl adenosine modification protein YjeE
MGKTIFAKGVAEFLYIKEKVVSPTYSYIEEYDFTRHHSSGKFYHLDMWKVENQDHFERLEVDKLFGPNNVVVIEWFAQVQDFLKKSLEGKKVIRIVFDQENNDRQLTINTSS